MGELGSKLLYLIVISSGDRNQILGEFSSGGQTSGTHPHDVAVVESDISQGFPVLNHKVLNQGFLIHR